MPSGRVAPDAVGDERTHRARPAVPGCGISSAGAAASKTTIALTSQGRTALDDCTSALRELLGGL